MIYFSVVYFSGGGNGGTYVNYYSIEFSSLSLKASKIKTAEFANSID